LGPRHCGQSLAMAIVAAPTTRRDEQRSRGFMKTLQCVKT
jgi:hypothetical protein